MSTPGSIPIPDADFAKRAKGALYGLILGDIVGGCFRYSACGLKNVPSLQEITSHTSIFGLRFGFTPDSMLLLLGMDSLIECSGQFDITNQRAHAFRYLDERQSKHLDSPSNLLTISITDSVQHGRCLAKCSMQRTCNTVLMRNLPFAIARCLHPEQEPLAYYRDVASVTHGCCESTVKTTQQMGLLLERLLCGLDWESANAELDTEVRHQPISCERKYRGFCEDSWALALHLIEQRYRENLDWDNGIEWIMNIGGHTDTNAAIYGQLYGALFPEKVIPLYAIVRDSIHCADEIDERFDKLLAS